MDKAAAARRNGKKGGRPRKAIQLEDEAPEVPWSRWYRQAREEAAFRYGLRHVPTDHYKEEWALGSSVTSGVKNIAKRLGEPVSCR